MMADTAGKGSVALPADESLLARLVGFIRFMRGNGYQVGVQEKLDSLKIAEYSGIMNQQRLRWGLRALLCSSNEDWERFDTLFDAYWKPANRSREVPANSYAKKLDSKNGLGGDQGNRNQIAEADQARQGEPLPGLNMEKVNALILEHLPQLAERRA